MDPYNITGTIENIEGGDGVKLVRNNTSFVTKLNVQLHKLHSEYKKLLSDEDRVASVLQYHQWLVTMLINKEGINIVDAKGILVYHPMGMGKTRIAIASAIIALKHGKQPVIVTPKGLQNNMLDTITEVMKLMDKGVSDADILSMKKKFSFVSSDAYNLGTQLNKLGTSPLENKLLIIDEAHNFFRAIVNSTNDETNARKLYNLIMNTPSVTILPLTGSPIVKNVFEIVPMVNMLAGKEILPIQYDVFEELFVDHENLRIKNRELLKSRLLGIISHASSTLPSEPGMNTEDMPKPRDDGYFPELFPLKVIRVEMSVSQYKRYLLAREKEDAEMKRKSRFGVSSERLKKGALSLPSSEIGSGMSTYHVKSRMISNFCPADEFVHLNVEDMPDIAFSNENSPKLALIAKHIASRQGAVVAYSQFVDYGLNALGGYLRNLGMSELLMKKKGTPKPSSIAEEESLELKTEKKMIGGIKTLNPNISKSSDSNIPKSTNPDTSKFAFLTGRVDPADRKKIQDIYCAPDNKLGEKLKLLGFSATGAEGLDLKFGQTYEGIEPYWYQSRDDQAIARVVRPGSHDLLPKEMREVHPFIYLSTANKEIYDSIPEGQYKEPMTIDEKFYERSRKNHLIINDMRQIFREVSIECVANGYPNCKMCSPTDIALFHDDVQIDVKLPDPCKQSEVKEIETESIYLGEDQYFYRKLEDNSTEFYQYDADLGAYVSISPDDPIVEKLKTLIEES